MTWRRAATVVARKELREAVRDRRSLGSALLYALWGPLVMALARALVHDPPNVVLDEPTNGLDVLGAREVRHEIRRLAEAGRAVVLSTHVMPDVSAVCDRIVVVARGRVVACGTPAAILARTGAAVLEDAFVAAIGSEEGLQ